MKFDEIWIVLVYLGKYIPDYVVLNANRISSILNSDVYLFIEKDSKMSTNLNLSSKVKIRELPGNEQDFIVSLEHDRTFRKEFWIHTFERLLHLRAIHHVLGTEKPILHVESDMLIFRSFPLGEVCQDKIRWFGLNEESDVASLVYLPEISATEWLHDQLLNEMRKDPFVTDMSALKRIRDASPERIKIFDDPFAPNEQGRNLGIFDGASLGVWICGTDRRNTFGIQFLHENGDLLTSNGKTLNENMKDAKLDIKHGNLIYEKQGISRLIHCLHIHSKDKALFQLDDEKALSKYTQLTHNTLPIVIEIDWFAAKKLLSQNLRQRTLRPYMLNFIGFIFKGRRISELRIVAVFRFLFSVIG